MSKFISLATAITLTGWSERTFWRRFADGSILRNIGSETSGKSMVHLDSILPHLCMPMDSGDLLLVIDADNGQSDAQADLALLFLSNGKYKESVHWLQLAVKHGHASAMHCLGRAYIDGNGVPKDENIGLMWIAKAAANGHVISQAQIQGLINGVATLLPTGRRS